MIFIPLRFAVAHQVKGAVIFVRIHKIIVTHKEGPYPALKFFSDVAKDAGSFDMNYVTYPLQENSFEPWIFAKIHIANMEIKDIFIANIEIIPQKAQMFICPLGHNKYVVGPIDKSLRNPLFSVHMGSCRPCRIFSRIEKQIDGRRAPINGSTTDEKKMFLHGLILSNSCLSSKDRQLRRGRDANLREAGIIIDRLHQI